MNSWEDRITDRILPELGSLWVVADHDALIRNERVATKLIHAGFEILPFEDPLAFRFRYESGARADWERGGSAKLLVVFDPDAQGFNRIPADILARAQRLELSLSDLFPNFNASVLRELEPDLWSRLYESDANTPPMKSQRETQDLILRSCFEFDPAAIRTESELLRILIRLHRSGKTLHASLIQHVHEMLLRRPVFRQWPLRELLTEGPALWRFLQERWPGFIHAQLGQVAEPLAALPEPERLPFAHDDVRVHLENLFREGVLKPVRVEVSHLPTPLPWWAVGIRRDAEMESSVRLREQRARLLADIPGDGASHRDWQQFVMRYSQHVYELFSSEGGRAEREPFWQELWPAVDAAFSAWFAGHYDAVHTLPPNPPVVVHHVPRFLQRRVQTGQRIALLVLDGLSVAQWNMLGPLLREELPASRVVIEESAILTWVPSITPIGRQSIFSGMAPLLFGPTIDRTDRDGARWNKFWRSEAALAPSQSAHRDFHGAPSDLDDFATVLEARPMALGATLSAPDQIMHGANLGWQAMFSGLRLWMSEGVLRKICAQLMDAGYEIYLSADHGNIEAFGIGRIPEGVLADRRGDRFRRYPNPVLREKTLETLTGKARPLTAKGLPEDYHALVATGRGAFIPADDRLVCHGGLSLDEVFVPWVRIATAAPEIK